MSVASDPRYQALAAQAAASLGAGSPEIARAIAAQWQCEQPANAWPPVHNNPGFVTVAALKSVGVDATPAARAPGSGFLAAFDNPESGAAAYAALLARGRRYAPARAAAARGDGLGFLAAVTAAGYGTRYGCASSVYRRLGTSAAAPPATSTVAAGGPSTLADYLGRPASDLLTIDLLRQIVPKMAKETGEKEADLFAFYVDFIRQPLGSIPAPGKAFNDQSFGGAPRGPDLATGLSQAFATFAGALQDVAARTLLVAAIVGLVVIGIVMVVRGPGSSS